MDIKSQIFDLRSKGMSYRQIQKELNCSKGLIAYYLSDGQKQKYAGRSNISKTKKRREVWKIKEDSGCIDCGEKYPHYMLQFDHKPGFEKIGSVSEIYSRYGREKGLEEMAKCDIVCANCHCIRTYNRNQNGIKKI